MSKSQEVAAQELRDALAAADVRVDYAGISGNGFRISVGEDDFVILVMRYSESAFHINRVTGEVDDPVARLNDAHDVAALMKSRLERAAA